jgi:hypothetical protein
MVDIKWWEPLILTIPITCIGLSNCFFENLGLFMGNYIMIFVIIYVLKIIFSNKNTEKVIQRRNQ